MGEWIGMSFGGGWIQVGAFSWFGGFMGISGFITGNGWVGHGVVTGFVGCLWIFRWYGAMISRLSCCEMAGVMVMAVDIDSSVVTGSWR